MTNKSFQSFFSELMILLMIIPQKMNFLQFARNGNSCEFGKMTSDFSYFCSGCICCMKRGLEILGIALVDAKNYTGLTYCQAREKKKLDFHFNASLTVVNVSHTFCKSYAKENGI